MQSVLPEHLIRVTIGDLVPGEKAYILPWSIAVDSQNRMWVRIDHEFNPVEFGTSRVRITRRSGYFSVDRNTFDGGYFPMSDYDSREWADVLAPVVLE